MSKPKKFWTLKLDSFSLLLAFFVLIISMLFGYLLKVDRDIRNYDTYRQTLRQMVDLNHQWENFYLKKYRYLDYDEISSVTQTFDVYIEFLENSDLEVDFGTHINKELHKIERVYTEKLSLLESFKTVNSRVTNSIHYLYDLRKTINRIYADDLRKRELFSQVFFTMGQILMDLPHDEKKMNAMMQVLKSFKSDNKTVSTFYQHTVLFLSDIKSINHTQNQNKSLQLHGAISHLILDLIEYYNTNRTTQKYIAMSFFLFAFFILMLLIFNYRRVRKTTRELSAFRYAIENSDNSIVITDLDRRIEYVNEAFEKYSGYTKEEVLGENPNILKSDLVSDEVYKKMNKTLDAGQKWQGELINRRKDGSLIYERASIVPIFMENELVQYLAIKLDITEYIKQQKILQQSAIVYETIGDGIVITNKDEKIVSVNQAFCKIFGYSEEELLGKEPMVVTSMKKDLVFYKKMWQTLLMRGRWSGRMDNRAKDGKIIPIWLTIVVVRNDQDEIQNFIAVYTNLEEIIKMEEKAEYLAYHDSLTHLPNRANFERKIVDILELAKESQKQVSVLFLDLDRFKVINDTLGHHIGDEMLVVLSQRIQKLLGKEDHLARIGGDEFVIILDFGKDKKDAAEMAQKILSVIREPISIHDYHLTTTASIGIAIYPDDGLDRHDIVKHADAAMYHAKDKGKDNYQFYTEQLSLDVEARLVLEQELVHALERDELSLHYQPQYYLSSGKISGAEALLRWQNKRLGWVSPDTFIAIAEETGAIVDIGYFVFEEACMEFVRWSQEELDIGSISINISSIQFREDDIVEKFKAIILKTGIPAHKIEIEITERFIMEYSTTNFTILEDLRNIGCKISIDDFGTGYSSLSYIKSLSLDTIKIDKSFISDLPDDTHDAEVSKAIIALSKSLNYSVVAEGIETVEQEAFLRKHKCDIGQGYYFARPMDAEAFVTFAKAKQKS